MTTLAIQKEIRKNNLKNVPNYKKITTKSCQNNKDRENTKH